MKPSKILLISVFITATILIVVGVVATTLMVNDKSSETQTKYDQLLQQASQTQADYDQLVKQANQREAQYQQLVQEANQKLEKANNDLLAMQSQLNQVQQAQSVQPQVQKAETVAATTEASPAVTSISPEIAGQLAQQVAEAGQKLIKAPELVDFQGKTAYEALFDKGSIYVDAQDGTILFNATVPQQINADQAAQIVTDYMNYKNVLQVDLIHMGTQALYRVILKNGYIAYVDTTGQITHINPPGSSNTSMETSNASSSSSSSSKSSHTSSPAKKTSSDDGGGSDD
jgi:predicted RND superfamily exporter protein